MAEIPLQSVSIRKIAVALLQAAAGDTAQVGPNKFLVVQNGDAAPHTVTVAVPGTDYTGAATPNLIESIAVGEVAIIPLGNQYADAAAAIPYQATITYDATPATLKRAVVALI
jgi:hypothetical protein